MNYLVTGGAGFIGSHIVSALVMKGARVRVLDDLSTGRKDNLSDVLGKIEFLKGDIRDANVTKKAVSGIDVIFHQAALPSVPRSFKDPCESLSVNGQGTLELLLSAKNEGVKCFIYASSSSVYGLKSPYAVSKALGEQYCILFSKLYNLRTVCLRYFNVFGPRQDPNSQYAAVIPKFIHAVKTKKTAVIYGDGGQTRDFTFVRNVVDANLSAAQIKRHGVYDIGCGEQTSVKQLFNLIKETLDADGKFEYGPPRFGDMRNSRADIAKAKKDLSYKPTVDLEAGLRLTADA